MAKPSINLSDFEDMLSLDEPKAVAATEKPLPAMTNGGLQEMDFSQMESFPNHKFKLYEGQRLADMVDSISHLGILLPLILWHTKEDRYIILSGHNRKNAGQISGLNKGPVIIKENLSFAEARLIVTETNLRQRSLADMSHSERAYCLAEHYEALKAQGKRSDLLSEIETLLNPHNNSESGTCAEVQHKLKSREKVGGEYGLSRDKVAKYIRLAELVPALLNRVDTGEIAFLAAYDLSFVEDTAKQQQIADLMKSDSYKVDMKKAELLRNYHETDKLTDSAIAAILSGEKTRRPKSDKPKPVKVKPTVISKYFTAQQTAKEIEGIIDKALAFYFENRQPETEVTA